jgi:hypothetical protein
VSSLSRRTVLKGSGMMGLATLLPLGFIEGCADPVGASGNLRVLDVHQAAVVRAATARLIPGPQDDPAERGHPGAREANVTRYIDTMLGALTITPAEVYADGPFSNRAGNPTDDMATFIGLTAAQKVGWSRRLAGLRKQYERGVVDLDHLAGGDFVSASPQTQDDVLGKDPTGFTQLLFTHAIEGMYSAPEYGGNANLVGWREIGFPGDRQPMGYTDREVSRSDGPDVYEPSAVGAKLLKLIQSS